MRHNNNIRDFEANQIKTIQNNVEIKPALQKIENERINGRTGDQGSPIYELEEYGDKGKMRSSIFV